MTVLGSFVQLIAVIMGCLLGQYLFIVAKAAAYIHAANVSGYRSILPTKRTFKVVITRLLLSPSGELPPFEDFILFKKEIGQECSGDSYTERNKNINHIDKVSKGRAKVKEKS